jgi:hypothetical protein
MKKLISISVVLILLASAAFADVGATVIGSATLASGSTKEYVDGADSSGKPIYVTDRIGSGFGIGRIRLSASGALEDGSIGGSLRHDDGAWSGWAFWKPSDLLKLQIGVNPDGEFGLDGIGRWGFYQLAGDVGVVSAGNAWGGGALDGQTFSEAFFGGYGSGGLVLFVTPADGFAINIGIPLANTSGYNADDKKFGSNYLYQNLANSVIQVKYDIDGVGTVGLTYSSGLGLGGGEVKETVKKGALITPAGPDVEGKIPVYGGESTTGTPIGWEDITIPGTPAVYAPDTKTYDFDVNNDSSTLRLYFGLSSIENLGIDIGIGYQLPSVLEEKDAYTITKTNPIAVGLGVTFNSGTFGLKTRVLGKFGGNMKYDVKGSDAYTLADDFAIVVDVLPSFAINDNMTFYLSAGIAGQTGNEEIEKYENGKPVIVTDNSALVAWHVNPYICITPSYWTAAFFAGLRIDSPTTYFNNGEKGDVRNRMINWSIPIGIIVNF